MPHAPKPPPPAQRLSPAMKYLEEREIPLMPATIVKIHRYIPSPVDFLNPEQNHTYAVMRREDEIRFTTSNDKHFSCDASTIELVYPEPDTKLAIYNDPRTGRRVARQIHQNYVYSQSRREF